MNVIITTKFMLSLEVLWSKLMKMLRTRIDYIIWNKGLVDSLSFNYNELCSMKEALYHKK